MDCCCGKITSNHHSMANVGQCHAINNFDTIIYVICRSSIGNEDCIFDAPIFQLKKWKKQSRKQHLFHLYQQMDNSYWKDFSNSIVKDNVQNQILMMNAPLFHLEILYNTCSQLGFMPHRVNNDVCHLAIIKAMWDGKMYDNMIPNTPFYLQGNHLYFIYNNH